RELELHGIRRVAVVGPLHGESEIRAVALDGAVAERQPARQLHAPGGKVVLGHGAAEVRRAAVRRRVGQRRVVLSRERGGTVRPHTIGEAVGERGRLGAVVRAGVEVQRERLQPGEPQQPDREDQQRDEHLYQGEPALAAPSGAGAPLHRVRVHQQFVRETAMLPAAPTDTMRPRSPVQPAGSMLNVVGPAVSAPRGSNATVVCAVLVTTWSPPLRSGHTRRTSVAVRTTQPVLQSVVPLQVAPLVLLHTVTVAARRVASLRARFSAVTRSLVWVVARLFWMMSMKPGTPNDSMIAATATVMSSS